MARAMTAREREQMRAVEGMAAIGKLVAPIHRPMFELPEPKVTVTLGVTVLEVTGLDDRALQKEMGLEVIGFESGSTVLVRGTRANLAILQDDLVERGIGGEFGFCMDARLRAASKRLAKSLGRQLDAMLAGMGDR